MPNQRQASQTYSSLLLATALLFQAATLSAQITIAVLDFDAFGISQTEAIALSNRLRNELFRLGTFEVVDRGMMENILAEQDFQQSGCTSNDCLVEVGRLLGAQQMVGGSISKVGQTFSVSARMVDVETGKVLSVSDFDRRGEIDEMLTLGMREVALMLSPTENLTVTDDPLPSEATEQEEETLQSPPPAIVLQESVVAVQRHRWQIAFGASFTDDGSAETSVTHLRVTRLDYEQRRLLFIRFQPAITVGIAGLSTYFYEAERFFDPSDRSFTDVYAMAEMQFARNGPRFGRAVYIGLGLAITNYERFYVDSDLDEAGSGLTPAFALGGQLNYKLWVIPTLVADLRIYINPAEDAVVTLGFGIRF